MNRIIRVISMVFLLELKLPQLLRLIFWVKNKTGIIARAAWTSVRKSGRTGQSLYVSPETDTVNVFYSSAYKAELWVHAYAREIVKHQLVQL